MPQCLSHVIKAGTQLLSVTAVGYPAATPAFSCMKEMLVGLLKAEVLQLCSGLLQYSLNCRFLTCVAELVVFPSFPKD